MSKLAAKQINKYLAAVIALSGVAVPNANSVNITSALTSSLNSAGDGGVAVPLQAVSSLPATAMGVSVVSTDNEVDVTDATTGLPIAITGNRVYGRITYNASGPAYTVSFYTLVNGTETAAAINQSVTIYVPYIFDFANYPQDGGIRYQEMRPSGTSGGNGISTIETISATANNTLNNLSKPPVNTANVVLNVNGQDLYAGDHFTVSAAGAITISGTQSTNIGFTIATTDLVKARYQS